jgi:DNA-binding protein HU-beta
LTRFGAGRKVGAILTGKGGESNVNKTDLIEKVAQKTGLTLKDARIVVETIFNTRARGGIIAQELSSGRKVQITGFGTFETRKRKKREGRNPQTGETITIPATKFPAFTAGKALKERVKK